MKIKAIAKKGDDYSSVAEATYTLQNPAVPTFDIAAGAVARNTIVTISSAEGTTIYYTTNGDNADTGTDTGTNSVEVTINEAKTIKAIAVDPVLNMSSEVSASYSIAQVASPTFSVAEGEVVSGTTVTLTTATEGAAIHYTTNGDAPTASSATYSEPIVIDADMTIKAIAVKDNYVDSEIASADYTTIEAIAGYAINFEADDLKQYVDWDMTNVGVHTTGVTSAHSGSAWGSNVNGSDNGVATLIIKTKEKVAYPGVLTCYISKESSNTSSSTWYIQVSSDGSNWTDIATLTSMTQNSWKKFEGDIAAKGYTNVYVRLYYNGSTAKRAVDDIVLTEYVPLTITCTGGLASFSYSKALDFTGSEATAYIIKSTSENYATLTQVTKVPANTGIIVTGTKDETYNIPVTNAETDDVTGNLLKATSTGAKAVEKDEAYGLSKTDGLFHLLNAGTIPVNKAYLVADEVFPTSTPAPSLMFNFGETTGISRIDNGELRMENGVYNLAGQRVAKPTKGLYIVNGRKVVIK